MKKIVYATAFTLAFFGSIAHAQERPAGNVGLALGYYDTWERYHLFVATASVARAPNGTETPDMVRVSIVKDYGVALPGELIMPRSTLIQGPNIPAELDPASPRTFLVMFASKPLAANETPHLMCERLDPAKPNATISQALDLISTYRRAAPDAKASTVDIILKSRNCPAIEYLADDWGVTLHKPSDHEKAAFLAVRDDATLAIYTRLSASRYLCLRDDVYRSSDAHFNWIVQLLPEHRKLDTWSWQRLFTDMSRFAPARDRADFEAMPWSYFKGVLADPATDPAETKAMLRELSGAGVAIQFKTPALLSAVTFLLEQAGQQVQETDTVEFLETAHRIMMDVHSSIKNGDRKNDLEGFKGSLADNIRIATDLLSKSKDAQVRQTAQRIVESMDAWSREKP